MKPQHFVLEAFSAYLRILRSKLYALCQTCNSWIWNMQVQWIHLISILLYVNLAPDHFETVFGMHLICNRHVTNDKYIAYFFKWMSWTIQKDFHILLQISQIHYLFETQITIYKKINDFLSTNIRRFFSLHASSQNIHVSLKFSGASIVILSGVCHFHYKSILQTNLTEFQYLVPTVDLDNIMAQIMLSLLHS